MNTAWCRAALVSSARGAESVAPGMPCVALAITVATVGYVCLSFPPIQNMSLTFSSFWLLLLFIFRVNLASFVFALVSLHTGLCTANDPDLVSQSGVEEGHLGTTTEYNSTVEVQAKAPPQDVTQTLKGTHPNASCASYEIITTFITILLITLLLNTSLHITQ